MTPEPTPPMTSNPDMAARLASLEITPAMREAVEDLFPVSLGSETAHMAGIPDVDRICRAVLSHLPPVEISEEMVERAARAISEAHETDPDGVAAGQYARDGLGNIKCVQVYERFWQLHQHDARAALQAALNASNPSGEGEG